jgi:hypothetical protein
MLMAHVATLAEARSYLAALVDHAQVFEASVEYERVLLHLDFIHGNDGPAHDTAALSDDREVLYALASWRVPELRWTIKHARTWAVPGPAVARQGWNQRHLPPSISDDAMERGRQQRHSARQVG